MKMLVFLSFCVWGQLAWAAKTRLPPELNRVCDAHTNRRVTLFKDQIPLFASEANGLVIVLDCKQQRLVASHVAYHYEPVGERAVKMRTTLSGPPYLRFDVKGPDEVTILVRRADVSYISDRFGLLEMNASFFYRILFEMKDGAPVIDRQEGILKATIMRTIHLFGADVNRAIEMGALHPRHRIMRDTLQGFVFDPFRLGLGAEAVVNANFFVTAQREDRFHAVLRELRDLTRQGRPYRRIKLFYVPPSPLCEELLK